MARHLLVVLTNSVAGRDDEFNDWYTNRHLDDMLKIEGVISARRFRYNPREGWPDCRHKYLALYEVETDDLPALQKRLAAAAGTELMPFSDVFDRGDTIGWYFEQIGESRELQGGLR
jgi:hypothetical protein